MGRPLPHRVVVASLAWQAQLDRMQTRSPLTALGIDLASKGWAHNGIARVDFDARRIRAVELGGIPWPNVSLTANALADVIDRQARATGARAVAIDGPHAWRDPDAAPDRPGVGRRAEYEARCPGKTGVVGVAYPRTFLRWIEFSIAVFERLLMRPDVELLNDVSATGTPPTGGYWVFECFPTATWRSLGLTPLPGHSKAPRHTVRGFSETLRTHLALPGNAETDNHDDLQALVAALVAAATLGGPGAPIAYGERARRPTAGGTLVEGFIWDVRPS